MVSYGADKFGDLRELGILITQCFKQVLSMFKKRSNAIEKWSNLQEKDIDEDHHSLIIKTEDAEGFYTYFLDARRSKVVFSEACKLFTTDPDQCFVLLQDKGFLPKPLTAGVVAAFLRSNRFLDKEAVGAFLGALGKDKSDIEWKTVEFHSQLLTEYVKTFELADQSALSCLRIFLSAFRLPGEAQQIDRILVAFSEHCHQCCKESKDGTLENSEVTYLLMFSIIMLNTDRHNPNIRPERKMTLEQFIRNNLNYGKDVNQTKPIPREYLVELYNQISEYPLRTEPNNAISSVTIEEWTDMYLRSYTMCNDPSEQSFDLEQLKSLSKGSDSSIIRFAAFLKSGKFSGIFQLTGIDSITWIWDKIIITTCWQYLLSPGVAAFIANRRWYHSSKQVDDSGITPVAQGSAELLSERVIHLLDVSMIFLREFLELAVQYSQDLFVDITIRILSESAGIFKVPKYHFFLLLDLIFGRSLALVEYL